MKTEEQDKRKMITTAVSVVIIIIGLDVRRERN